MGRLGRGCYAEGARHRKELLGAYGGQRSLAPEPFLSGDYSSRRDQNRALHAQSKTILPVPGVLPSTGWSRLSHKTVPQSTLPPSTVIDRGSRRSSPRDTHSLARSPAGLTSSGSLSLFTTGTQRHASHPFSTASQLPRRFQQALWNSRPSPARPPHHRPLRGSFPSVALIGTISPLWTLVSWLPLL